MLYEPSERFTEDIENRFTYSAPSQDQIERYRIIRHDAKMLALMLTTLCPESRELSLALTHLEECVMQANASIARHEEWKADLP